MTLELVMQVSRAQDSRLSGTVRLADDTETHGFSGTLELMRVFEDLVPTAGSAAPDHFASRSEGAPGYPEAPAPSDPTNS